MSYYGYASFPELYKRLETDIGNLQETSGTVDILVQIDSFNLASAGEREALEWTRKYLELYPPTEGKKIRTQAAEYLAIKGDERYVEILKQYDDDYGRLLATRMAGTNVFGSSDFGIQMHWGGMFIPSATNTGPQAVYVREILYRYWEEHGRDSSNFPQELLTMVVSFDENGNPVSSVDLAKYGLSVPIITPRPHKDIFNWWNEYDPWANPKNASTKLTVEFPDLAELVEITPYMRDRNSPDWEGLYIHVPKKGGATASPPSREGKGKSGVEDKGRATASRLAVPGTASPYLLLAILAVLCVGIAVWLLRRRGKK